MAEEDPQRPKRTPEQLVEGLVALLDVEELDADLYRGMKLPGGQGRVFGGQVIGQALQAAQRSSEGKDAHSLHAYFMRAGDDALPIIYRVVHGWRSNRSYLPPAWEFFSDSTRLPVRSRSPFACTAKWHNLSKSSIALQKTNTVSS